MHHKLNLAHHRKQCNKTGGGRAVTPPPTPAGSSSPVVSLRKNINDPNQLTFVVENGRKSGVDKNVRVDGSDEMDGSLLYGIDELEARQIELLQIDRQIKIEQLNTVKDNRKFQAEYNAENFAISKKSVFSS